MKYLLSTFFSFMLVFSNLFAQDSLSVSLLDEIDLYWESIRDFEKAGDIGLFVTTGTGLMIADVSGISNTLELSRVRGDLRSVDLVNDTTAVCIDINNQSIEFINFCDPTNPVTEESYYLTTHIPRVDRSFFENGYLYVNASYSLYTFRINDNYQCEYVAENPVSSFFSFNDFLLYDYDNEFSIYDFRDMEDVQLISSLPVNYTPDFTCYHQGYVYIAARINDNPDCACLITADVSNIHEPAYVDTVVSDDVTRRTTVDMIVAGNRLLVSDYSYTRVYDISTPGQPVYIGVLENYAGKFYSVESDRLYHSVRSSNVLVSRFDENGQSELIEKLGLVSVANDLQVYKDYLYLFSSNYLTIFDISDASDPQRLVDIDTIPVSAAYINNGFLYAANSQDLGQSIHIYSLENPESPQLISSIGPFPEHYISDIKTDESFLYLAKNRVNNQGSVDLYDISDPYNPQLFNFINPGLPISQIEYHRQYLTICFGGRNNQNFTLYTVYDVTDPAQVVELYTEQDYLIWGPLGFDDLFMYKTSEISDENKTEIISLADNSVVNEINHQFYYRTGFQLNGSLLFTSFDTQNSSLVEIFNFYDLYSPQRIAFYENGTHSWHLASSQNHIFGLKIRELAVLEYETELPLQNFKLLSPLDMQDLDISQCANLQFLWQSSLSELPPEEIEYTLDIHLLNEQDMRISHTFEQISDTTFSVNIEQEFDLQSNEDYLLAWSVEADNGVVRKSSENSRRFVVGNWNPVDGEQNDSQPLEYSLGEIYPNPFNSQTVINFSLPTESRIFIKVYNTLGQEVDNIIDYIYEAGNHQVTYNASQLSSGIYFCVLSTDKFKAVKKMMFLR